VRHLARQNDSHRIVRRTQIGKQYQQADAAFARLHRGLGGKLPGQPVHALQQPADTAVVTHELPEAAHQHGEHHDLVHAHKTAVNILAPLDERIAAHRGNTHRAGKHDARQQHDEHVHARERHDQNSEIRDNADKLILLVLDHLPRSPGKPQQGQRDERRGQGDEQVHAELVLHLAALRAGGGNGRIRDHGQVVPEHGPAHDHAEKQGQRNVGLLAHAHRNGRNGGHGPHAGAHRRGNERPDEEQARQDHGRGQQREPEIDRSLHPAYGRSHGREPARKQEDHAHGDDVDFTHA